jgi:hypothetical protein
MYEAKRAGRDRVVMDAHASGPQPDDPQLGEPVCDRR